MYQSINPTTGEGFGRFDPLDAGGLEALLATAAAGFARWRRTDVAERVAVVARAAALLQAEAPALGRLATLEMGKTWLSAKAEVRKCAAACRWFADHGAALIAPEPVELEGATAEVRHLPLGVVLAVMPWNFPYWQVVRFLAPALVAGNAAILKHAPSTPGCALAIVDLFARAGLPDGVFQNAFLTNEQAAAAIADDRVAAVTLTGSERAGIAVGQAAAGVVKKAVLELGGSDPLIVLPSADIAAAAKAAVTARNQNNGQSCVCAKRFIVHDGVYDAFVTAVLDGTRALKVGDPLLPDTDVGPLSSHAARDHLAEQVAAAVAAGAAVLTGGEALPGPGAFYAPTVLGDVPRDAPIAREEFFGPVALLFRVADLDEAIAVANAVPFGLGSSVWTADAAERERCAAELDCGMTFFNAITASDPRLPFGGVKRSGHGRELGLWGLREFVNVKTVVTAAPKPPAPAGQEASE